MPRTARRTMPLPTASLVACLALPAPLPAQEGPASTPEAMRAAIEACLETSPDRETGEACIGGPSDACMAMPANQTTVGMGTCVAAETRAWDALLNAAWPKLKATEAEADAADGMAAAGLPTRAETLLAAQRAWIAFRDAECAHAYAQGGTGTIRSLYGASCRLTLTARRALEFRAWLAGGP